MYDLSQPSTWHMKGRSPVWDRWWAVNLEGRLNAFVHPGNSQVYFLSSLFRLEGGERTTMVQVRAFTVQGVRTYIRREDRNKLAATEDRRLGQSQNIKACTEERGPEHKLTSWVRIVRSFGRWLIGVGRSLTGETSLGRHLAQS